MNSVGNAHDAVVGEARVSWARSWQLLRPTGVTLFGLFCFKFELVASI